VDEAIRLSPKVARYWGLKANCESAAGNWKAMLAAAETGLEQDATHQHCKNLRALALAKLGNKDAASALFSENLGVNPENALTFAYQGWTHLHNGEPNDAITAFSECLRLQPNLDWARLGMMTALRDRLWLFRLSRAVSSWRALLALLIGVFVTGAATAISWIYWEHHHWIAPLALLCTLVCIANFLCYFLACLRIHRMRDDFLKTIMLFDARGQYLLTQEERRKAWRCALMAPLGFILGALMVTFSERKHASDAGFIMLMSCLCVVCYIALGLKWLANRDRGH
jgi:tetratricopeptide (TPR) repeat protein